MTLPSAEDFCTGNYGCSGLKHLSDCDCICESLREYANAVLEAAAEVARERGLKYRDICGYIEAKVVEAVADEILDLKEKP